MNILNIFEWNTKIDLIEIFSSVLIALFTAFITVYLTNVFNKKKVRRNIINKLTFSLDDILEFREYIFKTLDLEYQKKHDKKILRKIRNQTNITFFENGKLALNKEKVHMLINLLTYRELNEHSSFEEVIELFGSKKYKNSINGKKKKSIKLNNNEGELISEFLSSYAYFKDNKINDYFNLPDNLLVLLKDYLNLLENLSNDFYVLEKEELDILYKLKGYLKRHISLNGNNFEVTWEFYSFILMIVYINRIYLDEVSNN